MSAGIQKLLRIAAGYFTEESRLKGMQFKPDPTDVFVCTADKSGTTWVQQICHGLRSGGDMNFEEIGLVSPCLEMAHDYGYKDLEAPQPYAPRMYKTHLWYHSCPKGAGKYIVVCRYVLLVHSPFHCWPYCELDAHWMQLCPFITSWRTGSSQKAKSAWMNSRPGCT